METGPMAQRINADKDAPSKIVPFACVWHTSLKNLPIYLSKGIMYLIRVHQICNPNFTALRDDFLML